MRKYITQHVPGTYLTFDQRQTLASDWNELVRAGCRVTLRQFAAKHGLRYETWRREYKRRSMVANKRKVLYLLNLPNVEHTCKQPLTHKTAHMNDDAMAKRAIAALG